MTVRLLCIANPSAYEGATTDIPLSYARLASHPDIELFHADTRAMMIDAPTIDVVPVPRGFQPEEFQALQRAATITLPDHELDVAFCRTLKPFPPGYLVHLQRRTPALRFVNDPRGIEQQLQPDFVIKAAAEWMPPALMPTDVREFADFLAEHGTIVAKRANSCGGRGVYRICGEGALQTDNVLEGARTFVHADALYESLTDHGQIAILLMRYLSGVTRGERRVIAVAGEVYGAYVRRSPSGHWIQNLTMGGAPEPTEVHERERLLVASTSGAYTARGIHVLGYDLIQDDQGTWKVSEINAGNIGGLFRLEDLGVEGVTDRFVEWLHQFASQI